MFIVTSLVSRLTWIPDK